MRTVGTGKGMSGVTNVFLTTLVVTINSSLYKDYSLVRLIVSCITQANENRLSFSNSQKGHCVSCCLSYSDKKLLFCKVFYCINISVSMIFCSKKTCTVVYCEVNNL